MVLTFEEQCGSDIDLKLKRSDFPNMKRISFLAVLLVLSLKPFLMALKRPSKNYFLPMGVDYVGTSMDVK